jgi:cytochrome oxidase Cu insertion factor (SCO1/SenC/PrrC family)
MKVLPFVALVTVALGLAGPGGAADKAPPGKQGLAVGSKAPAFALKDQAGKERTLAELLKKGKVALVFYRSAGW